MRTTLPALTLLISLTMQPVASDTRPDGYVCTGPQITGPEAQSCENQGHGWGRYCCQTRTAGTHYDLCGGDWYRQYGFGRWDGWTVKDGDCFINDGKDGGNYCCAFDPGA